MNYLCKIVIPLFLLLSSHVLLATTKIISSSKPVPGEFRFLIESIQKQDLNIDNKAQFEKWMLSLDESFSVLNKDEIFFICKAEIYKAILKKYKDSEIDLKKFNNTFLKGATEKIEQVNRDKALSIFSKWMIQALYSDFKTLLTAPQYLNFVTLTQNATAIADQSFVIWTKKLKMVAPWLDLFINSDSSEFEAIIRPMQLEILKTISLYSDLLIRQSRFKEDWPKKKSTLASLNYFILKDVKESLKPVSVLDDTPVTTGSGSGSGEIPTAAWTPRDTPLDLPKATDASLSPTLPPNYPTPSADYHAPEKLPQPVNDWVQGQ